MPKQFLWEHSLGGPALDRDLVMPWNPTERQNISGITIITPRAQTVALMMDMGVVPACVKIQGRTVVFA